MLGLIERLDKAARKADRYIGGSVELPEYPGSLQDTYELLYPKYLTAEHLAPLKYAYERSKHEPVRVCVSFPPRAGKTETVIAAKVDRLLWKATSRLCYVTFGGAMAKKKSARIRSFARQVGVPIDQSTRSKQDWQTGIEEGGLWATSVGGAITGMGFELITLDDLLEGREDAESVIKRDRAWDFLKADVTTRLEPEGSMVLNGTRWHEDDPIGRAVAEGWEEINVPALDEHGNSYWPKRWTTGRLLKLRLELGGDDGYEWCSLYMGKPRSKGTRVFNPAQFVTSLPPGPARVGIGVDFAYTTSKSSDYSCAVVMAEIGGCYYVIDVLRIKCPEGEFRGKVAELAEKYQAQFVVGYVAKTEEANVTLLQRDGLPAFSTRAQSDKKTHALPAAAGWNVGRIKVLAGRIWEKPFTREVEWFTGSDRRDDQVDALSAIYDAMWTAGPVDWDWLTSVQDAAPKAYMGISN
jgi:predicted phage terminase large subunit-like protein